MFILRTEEGNRRSMKQVIYNAVHRMKSSPRLRSCSFLLLLLFWCGISGFGADWAGPVTQLAKAIASSTGPGTVTLSVVNASSLPNDQVPEIRRTLEAQLQSSGVRV